MMILTPNNNKTLNPKTTIAMYVDSDPKVEQKRTEYREELLKNDALWKHYDEYRKDDVERLIDSYALNKARLKVQGNYTQTHHQRLIEEWTDRCWFALCEIQSKKLFDLQCLWRAGTIQKLPGIKWSYDFDELAVPLLDYKGVPDITPDEIETYIQYLRSPQGEVDIHYGLFDYQNHDYIKKAHFSKDDGFMPDYYEYHYTVKGNTGLLSLPDLHADEEGRLIDLAMEFNQAKRKSAELVTPQPSAPQSKKSLGYHVSETQLELAAFLGEKDVAGFIKDLNKWVKEKPEFETDWAMDYLSRCYPENVSMPAAHRWQEAIQNAALQHINLKMQEMLPVIYDEYLMKKQLGSAIGYVSKDRQHVHPIVKFLELGEKLDRGEKGNVEDLEW
jgi:hypothetical protein